MSDTAKRSRRRLRKWISALLAVLIVAAGVATFLLFRCLPDYRTALLVDAAATSGPGAQDSVHGGSFGTVADAVGSVAQNAGDTDALSLRRFGGSCGSSGNTSEVVSSDTGHSRQISEAVRKITPAGSPTLGDGIAAAIDDFSGFYPFRGRKANRIVVVTSHGIDACTTDQTALLEGLRSRATSADVRLEFRFVGYRVPADQRDDLSRLTAALRAPEPRFVDAPTELEPTLKEVVSKPDRAKPIVLPSPSPATSSPAERWPFMVGLSTGWAVTVAGTPVRCSAATNELVNRACSFSMAEGQRITLTATISGPSPGGDLARLAEQNNPGNYKPARTPYWYGCDEGPRSRICTVTLTRERIDTSKRWAIRSPTGRPATRLLACVTTDDIFARTMAQTCASMTGTPNPVFPDEPTAEPSRPTLTSASDLFPSRPTSISPSRPTSIDSFEEGSRPIGQTVWAGGMRFFLTGVRAQRTENGGHQVEVNGVLTNEAWSSSTSPGEAGIAAELSYAGGSRLGRISGGQLAPRASRNITITFDHVPDFTWKNARLTLGSASYGWPTTIATLDGSQPPPALVPQIIAGGASATSGGITMALRGGDYRADARLGSEGLELLGLQGRGSLRLYLDFTLQANTGKAAYDNGTFTLTDPAGRSVQIVHPPILSRAYVDTVTSFPGYSLTALVPRPARGTYRLTVEDVAHGAPKATLAFEVPGSG